MEEYNASHYHQYEVVRRCGKVLEIPQVARLGIAEADKWK